VKYVDLILAQCGESTPKTIPTLKKPTTSRGSNSWICYLKNCAKTTNLTYLDCVKDKMRAKREYYPKKDYWEQEALKGC
jgi:hypothetical protein